jgi:ABC-type Fe3+/spermidine/putrescine transport system ATPase subunit
MQSGKPHIEVENLEIRYGDVQVVHGVSFVVRPGEQLTLLGPSGCGKTTTLRAIAGLEKPSAGEIRIDGAPVYSSARSINIPAEKRGLSMVFQSYAIWPHMSVFDNVAYGLRVRRLSRAEIAEKVDQALGQVQMRAFAQRSASPPSSPAASNSAWRWRGLSSFNLQFCCSTSHCPISTPSCAPICASSCASYSIGSASLLST